MCTCQGYCQTPKCFTRHSVIQQFMHILHKNTTTETDRQPTDRGTNCHHYRHHRPTSDEMVPDRAPWVKAQSSGSDQWIQPPCMVSPKMFSRGHVQAREHCSIKSLLAAFCLIPHLGPVCPGRTHTTLNCFPLRIILSLSFNIGLCLYEL